MFAKIIVVGTLLTPLVALAAPNENAFFHASPTGQANGKAFAVPEIDSSNLLLSLALLGGIVRLVARSNKNDKKDD